MRFHPLSLALGLALLLGAPLAQADVFVNGVKIYRLQNVTLEGCTVTFDAAGNVQVQAPGYEIRVQEPPAAAPGYASPAVAPGYAAPAAAPGYAAPAVAPGYAAPAVAPGYAPPPPAPTGRAAFALTTWAQQTITLPLTFDLQINGAPVRRFTAADEQLVLDLTPFLKPGVNTVRLSVEYDSMYAGVQPTAADRFAVRIQFGRYLGDQYQAERSLVEFSRDGTQMLGTIKEFQITL